MADSKTKFELAESHEAMDLVPNWEVEWWCLVLPGAVLLLVIFLGYLFLRKSKIQDPNQAKLLAYQEALAGLRKLDASIGKENVIIVSLALRQYLAKAMNEPALYETHEEFIGRHDAIKGLSEDLKLEITDYFSKLAAIKYGPDEGAVADVDTLKQGGNQILRKDSHGMIESFLIHFRFAQPEWLLLLIPSLLLLILRRGRGATGAVVFPNLDVLQTLGKRVNRMAWNLGLPLVFISLVLAILGMARPVWRNEYQSRIASGIDILIAFDVSLSMDIDDFRYEGMPMKRIDAAKKVVDSFITKRPDDRIGLVAFAGRPVSVSPITMDHDWLRSGLDRLRLNRNGIGTVKEQGTAIGSALATAATRLDNRDSKSKIIVLITDGASNSGKISPLDAAKHIKTLGIKTYTVAIGTKEGRVSGNIQAFPRQEFDLPTLRKIASDTGGEHFWAQNLEDLESNFRTIDQLEKTESRSLTITEDRELYMWFIISSLLAAGVVVVYMSVYRTSV